MFIVNKIKDIKRVIKEMYETIKEYDSPMEPEQKITVTDMPVSELKKIMEESMKDVTQ